MDTASLLTGENAAWLDHQHSSWLSDPGSVSPEWAAWFSEWRDGSATASATTSSGTSRQELLETAQRQARVVQLIAAYRVRGHTEADIDPLGCLVRDPNPELRPEYHGLTEADLHERVVSDPLIGAESICTVREILDRCRKAYCGTFGVEYMNIRDPARRRWLQERVETLQDREVLDAASQRFYLRLLSLAEGFESVLARRFPGTKRFSCEGAETLIPLLELIVEGAAHHGVQEIIVGMAHRGRLSVLANIFGKPVRQIVDEFEDKGTGEFGGSGDVKYHLGYSRGHTTRRGDDVWLSLAFNPSHLEAVDPVVVGRVRARQDRNADWDHVTSLPLLIHGDSAFAGQGLVTEVLNMSDVHGYRTGGTIHVIVNNQIGFTTSSAESRSTPYCTDVARMLAIPIFHVNGEDPVAVAAVAELAAAYRQEFHQDVVVDMYCYRKYGHNEGDEPSFTQPLLYDAIKQHPSAREAYARVLVAGGHLSQAEVDGVFRDAKEELSRQLDSPPDDAWDSYVGARESEIGRQWAPYLHGSLQDDVDTTYPFDELVALQVKANTVPESFHAHRKIERLLTRRLQTAHGDRPVDWAFAEQAAYATLVVEGFQVRLSGEDCGRGTFSHRHAALTDIQTGRDHFPLQHLADDQAAFVVFDSLLSEFGVLGFEFGYSLDYPDSLVVWEAQFGDFANGAQVIIDNFVMATEQKWNRFSGLVMLLPHGYEGQGPEHSSARLERYLQLCAQENVTVANCTTPASFFHLLRRQVHLQVRKPLVVMSPKSLLRAAECVSTLDDLATGSWQRVLDDEVDPAGVRRVVFCSGKVFYELREARGEATDVALVRLEQLYPFPAAEIRTLLHKYREVDVVWCQEEPRNMGAWPMMDEWLGGVLVGAPPRYVGRAPSASPATGSKKRHVVEQRALIAEALA